MNKWLRFAIGLFLVLLYFTPYFILGEDAHLRIHDNLDSNVAWVKLLIDNHMIFAAPDAYLDSVMGGLPLSSIYPTYSLLFILFKGFGIYYGYVTSKLVAALIGFVGMILLQEDFREKFSLNKNVIIAIAIMFAILPHWGFDASVTGVPIIFYALYQFYKNKAIWIHWLILIVMPFLSSFILTGLFILIISGVHYLYILFKTKKINWEYALGISILSIFYLISIIPILYSYFFDSSTVTHRVEFKSVITNTANAINYMYKLFLDGQHHSFSIHSVMLPLLLLYLIIAFIKKNSPKTLKFIVISLIFIILVSVFYGFKNHYLLFSLTQKLKALIPIQFDRFYMLLPTLWYFIFTIISSYLIYQNKLLKYLVIIIFLYQFIVISKTHELRKNQSNLSFKEFYAEDSFNELKQMIPESLEEFNTLSVGLHPAIAQYNKFATFDGYFATYPLNHKKVFRSIIYKELEKDSGLRDYFENWGSRCYAFSSEIGKNVDNNKPKTIHNLDFNFEKIRMNNIKYIFSSSEIESSQMNLVYKSIKNGFPIYLYKIRS